MRPSLLLIFDLGAALVSQSVQRRCRHPPSRVAFNASTLHKHDTSDNDLKTVASGMIEENELVYDVDVRTPLEAEFTSLMSTFLTYSAADIQSLTTTSARYADYHTNNKKRIRRTRSKEEGIRYRALFAGVQAASLEPDVLRSFTVLFEDYIPIRLAGRRIYSHLAKIMDNVREERRGEIARATDLCPEWAFENDADFLQYSRRIWDSLIDGALLLESNSSDESAVVTFEQLVELGVVQVLIDDGLITNEIELEGVARKIALQEKEDMGYPEDDTRQFTFPTFMKLLCHQYSVQEGSHPQRQEQLLQLLQRVELIFQEDKQSDEQDTSTRLTERTIHVGSNCRRRQKFSDRFDEYVSDFQVWEKRFLDDKKDGEDRRRQILRGCFAGAGNAQVKSALKIVYIDYRVLRYAGDLIFRLMSKIAN